ncbi:DUF5658 family protein [Mesobacillus subterraneus]|uniref:DUF5658 family protein n=1 Tax=Mesobacillus subterraneus TaxID=285983 RepID=UPI00203CC689|nr:DUF5658 family protein [Mesobacillus subterraneus]MCM3573748.1 DUF5658 family protein [Mesobacillus subterraneus]
MVLLFYYLSLLNLVDAALTVAGIERSLITEANPLMERVYSIDIGLFISLKILLSMTLLLFIMYKKVPQSRVVKGITLFATASYTAVICLHGFWLVQIV